MPAPTALKVAHEAPLPVEADIVEQGMQGLREASSRGADNFFLKARTNLSSTLPKLWLARENFWLPKNLTATSLWLLTKRADLGLPPPRTLYVPT